MGTFLVGKDFSFGNTGSRLMGPELVTCQKLDRMCRDDRKPEFVRQLDGMPDILFHPQLACPLYLDIEIPTKNPCPFQGKLFRTFDIGGFQRHADIPLPGT